MTEVLLEARGRVLIITLNRPEVRNAIDSAMAEGLVAAVGRLDHDPELAVGVLHGAGRGFCSGMDLKAFAELGAPLALDRFVQQGARKPLIAAIEGFALGGGLELALVCDLLVVAADARIATPETRVGLFAAGGALYRLPKRLPFGVAMEMVLSGDPIDPTWARECGLVSRVTAPGEALEQAVALAERIARNAPLAVVASKELVRFSLGAREEDFWAHQRLITEQVFTSVDAAEGPRAFAERRDPRWIGR